MTFAPLVAALALFSGTGAFDRDALVSMTRTLASPEFEGRLTLTPGARLAGDFIAGEMRRIGLRPGGEDGTFFHEFEVTVNQRPTRKNLLAFEGGGRRHTLRLGLDFVPLAGSSHDRLVRGPVVYLGYGIRADGRDDFAGADLRGRIALVLRGAPQGMSPVSNGQKARWAKEAGAIGIVFAGPSAEGRSELPRPTRGAGIPGDLGLVAAGITREAFRTITGLDYAAEAAQTASVVKELPGELRLVTGMEPNRGTARNVIGVLPGRDPRLREEVIIIGAHYDHLGYGEVASRTGVESIHYGADDNASGTAGMLALAQAFASANANRRTIIFQAYCAEEVGLVGAIAWVRDHPEIIARTTLMVNLDMIGRLKETMTVFGCASAKELNGILDGVAVEGLRSVRVQASPPNSDHAAFVRAGVPVLFFHTNLHPEYHTERDTVDLINFEGMMLVLESVRQTVAAVDVRDARLTFDPQAARVTGGGRQRPRGARVGFIPDMTDEAGPGVRITGVSPDSPAQKAGAQAGDRILRFGDREIRSLEDLQQALTAARPNVRVTVVILRGGTEMRLEVTPEAPAGG
jgi:hypothetical protein